VLPAAPQGLLLCAVHDSSALVEGAPVRGVDMKSRENIAVAWKAVASYR